jgi:hypothetical protein
MEDRRLTELGEETGRRGGSAAGEEEKGGRRRVLGLYRRRMWEGLDEGRAIARAAPAGDSGANASGDRTLRGALRAGARGLTGGPA